MNRLVFWVLAGALAGCGKNAAKTIPPPPVTVADVLQRDVPVVLVATGTAEPLNSVQVRAQVDGIITKVAFREGQEVRTGDVLFEIDPRPYQAELDKARAALARAEAQAAQARRDLARSEELATKEYVTKQQLDQARALVAELSATLQEDSAAVKRARLDLGFATIRAAISGRTGSVRVREGNLVRAAGGDPLVVINQLSPIQVRFSVPSSDLARIRRNAGNHLKVTAASVGDSAHQAEGTLIFFDNAVDTLTGTISLKAMFPNRERALWPGELVRVWLNLDVERSALVVPQEAILSGQQGSTVFTIADGKAALRKVQVLRTTDSFAILAGGLEPGEKVVVDGQLRLTDGAKVAVRTEKKSP